MTIQREDLGSIVPLDRHHDRAAFCCGVKHLDNYLKDAAISDQEKNLSRVFALTLKEKPEFIVGYYALSSIQIETKNFPAELLKGLKIKRQTIGATLLGKMAVSESVQRSGLKLDSFLLVDSMRQAYIANMAVASFAFIADIRPGEKGDPSEFYHKHGFEVLTSNPKRLFLPLATIEIFLKAQGLDDFNPQ